MAATFELEDNMAAIVLERDGSTKLIFEERPDHDKMLEHEVLAAAIACRLDDPEWCDELRNWFEEMIETLDEPVNYGPPVYAVAIMHPLPSCAASGPTSPCSTSG